jgi:hypothetical protein
MEVPMAHPTYYSSIDSHRRTCFISTINEQGERLEQQLEDLERALHLHLMPNEDVQRLLRIPGTGKAAACTIYLQEVRPPSLRR